MKLTQQQEVEIYKVHDTYWHSYLSGDVSTMSDLLSENYSQVGSAEDEVFDSKALALQFLHATIDQVAGKLEMRNRITTIQPLGELIMVHEKCDLFARSEENWVFYSRFRASTIMKHQQDGWKLIHQHSSFPDAKTEEGQNVAIDKITAENNQLREAVKRRTIELEYKNRELEIEAALERVRARTMAMQQQDELIDVITLLADQLVHLGVDLGVANFSNGLSYKDWDLWLYTNKAQPGKQTRRVFCPWIDHPYFHEVKAAIENFNKGIEFSVAVFGKADKDSFLDYVFAYTTFKNDYADLPDSIKEFLYNSPGYTWSAIVLKDTWVSICKYDIKPFTDKQNAILRRFTHAFGQAYTRFLDLQKAEAQTREAQIELSLEQVRARSLAMKCSDEMLETSDVMFSELEKLSINALRIGICTIDGKTGSAEVWSRSENKEQKKNKILGVVPNGTHPVFDNMVKAWKEKKPYYSNTRKGKEVIDYYKKLSAHLSYPLPAKYNKQETITTFFFTEGSLNVVSLQPLTEEEMQIMIRFAIVFGQIYQRFLDLQKAEAQAREGQIELSLERVRAKTMAMHNSADVGETASVMEDELKKLGIVTIRCGIGIMHQTGDMEVWTITTDETNKTHIIIGWLDMHIHPLLLGAFESWSKKNESYSYELKHDDLHNYYNAINNYPGYPIRYDTASLPNLIHHNEFYFPEGILFAFSLQQLTEDQRKIFKRFAGVFGQTYRRYLDLQKAEAQAREAQIEAAVERVRAQSMAMHQTADFDNVNKELFTQLKWLNVQGLTGVSFYFFDEDGEIRIHDLSSPGNIGNPNNYSIKFSAKKYPVLGQLWQDYKMLGEYTVLDYPLHKLKLAADEFKTININVANAITQGIKNKTLTHQWCAFAKISGGGLGIDLISAPIEETKTIAIKMAGAFNLAYQRFLDLQKAEAQTRESQIQLALERVRARTMAMQKSEELLETTFLLFEQFKALGETSEQFSIGIFNEADKVMDLYTTMYGAQWKEPVKVDLDEPVAIGKIYAAWKNKKKSLIIDLSGNDLKRFNAFRKKLSNIDYKEKRWVIHAVFFSKGVFTFSMAEPPQPEIIQLLERFAAVFEQTYTRFLDLQKAEAQAREATIEAAIEKVRSRTMAMHRSEELPEAAYNQFLQVKALDIPVWSAGYCIWDDDKQGITVCMSSEGVMQPAAHAPLTVDPSFIHMREAYERGEQFYVEAIGGNELVSHYNYMRTLPVVGQILDSIIKEGHPLPTFQIFHCCYFSKGFLLFITYEAAPEAHEIFKRFTKVFEQTYTRFLDLQKAEAQAREAQIENALEKVRSRSLAMHNSDELQQVVTTLSERMMELGIEAEAVTINIFHDRSKGLVMWTINSEKNYSNPFHLPYHEITMLNDLWKGKEDGVELLSKSYSFSEKNEFWNFAFAHSDYKNITEGRKKFLLAAKAMTHSTAFSKNSSVSIFRYSDKLFSERENEFLKRFARVFEQAYTRFLDLQKAEAQAREAQIEAALERVRSRTMAMQKSDELAETVSIFFKQLLGLGIKATQIRTCGIATFAENEPVGEQWITETNGEIIKDSFLVSYTEAPAYKTIYEAWKNGEQFLTLTIEGNKLVEHVSYLQKNTQIPMKDIQHVSDIPKEIYFHVLFFARGYLFIISYVPLTLFHNIFKRFGALFQQTYVRFLDFKKAEAQAREATIEAALERVRSKTMAMHNSEDVTSATDTMFDELKKLGIDNLRCGIANIHENRTFDVFGVTNLAGGNKMSGFGLFGMDEHPVWQRWFESWKQMEEVFIAHLAGQEKEDYFNNINNHPNYLPKPIVNFPDNFFQAYRFEQGAVWAYSMSQHSAQEADIMKRFATGFSLTFRRYQDLKKAEAQAREAQIEAALERVRSRSMGMQKSEEFKEVIQVVYDQFIHLDIHIEHTGFIMDYKMRNDMHIWLADYQGVPAEVTIPYFDSPHWNSFLQAKKNGETHFTNNLTFEEKNTFYKDLFELIPGISDNTKEHYLNCAALSISTVLLDDVGLYIENFSGTPFTDEENKILFRFGKVFQQTYTRFNDLQRAEKQAKDATRQASIDRVRGEIASMRTVNDLQRITPLLWRELKVIGVPFIRCGVFILNPTEEMLTAYMSAPDGSPLATLNLSFTANPTTVLAVEAWKKQEVFTDHWTAEKFHDWTSAMISEGQIENRQTYEVTGTSISSLHLHFISFTQGMLYVGNAQPLSSGEIELVKSLAEAFSLAYARYEDFVQIEKAKQHVEHTLVELKATQSQLIQSEKMASLGVLTAGIAHEIQNPLNFVNNFSEVSKELLDELKEEIEKGNVDYARSIMNDVTLNLEKINHHGKRADAIVKGMLQHSQSSTGKKEPTDINALCDEYLRLSYHGLRGKDKSFNATLKTDFDTSIGYINIISQDMGRVILNLLTNAFYVVHEKKKSGIENYEPTVSISTKKIGDKVEIKVTDNGNGIPPKVLDKIFQPFFTTKPSGQGTGLGLSLSYDLIKAHGGEISVTTKIEEGTTFIIQLPA